MYTGSQIPLFHFDLYNFKNYSLNNNVLIGGSLFDPARFLKGYYNYFYSLVENGNRKNGFGDTPTPIDISFSSLGSDYEYVTASLEAMVMAGILRVKDHAIDIATETTQIIQSAEYGENNDIILNPYVSAIVGGTAGYKNLIEFLGVTAVSGVVTPKTIKRKLLANSTASKFSDFQSFPFPRRAVLPTYIESGKAVAWGCTGDSCSSNPYGQSIAPDVLTTIDPDNNPWLPTGIGRVTAGLNTNYWHTYQGKLVVSGYNGANFESCFPPDLVANQRDQSAGTDVTKGVLIKIGGKSSAFEVALVEYPEFFDFNSLVDKHHKLPLQEINPELAQLQYK
jgi:hypothetical protein